MAISSNLGAGVSLRADDLIALRDLVRFGAGHAVPISALPGSFIIKKRGQGQDATGSRIYVAGDDVRHMDRGATARTGEPHVRTFREERDRVTFLVADFRPSMLWGTKRAFRSVAAAEALALLGWHAIETGARVGLWAITATGPVIVPTRGRVRGMLDVIGGMVTAHQKALKGAAIGAREPELDQALTGLKRTVFGGAEIYIASGLDTPGAGLSDLLGDLARRRDPKLIVVEDGVAQSLPPGFYPMQTQDREMVQVDVRKSDAVVGEKLNLATDLPRLRIDANAPLDARAFFEAA